MHTITHKSSITHNPYPFSGKTHSLGTILAAVPGLYDETTVLFESIRPGGDKGHVGRN
jgi:hypothetical protein